MQRLIPLMVSITLLGACSVAKNGGRPSDSAKHSDGEYFVFANDGDSGAYKQWRLEARGDKVSAREVRSFLVGSQAEGCAADDAPRTAATSARKSTPSPAATSLTTPKASRSSMAPATAAI